MSVVDELRRIVDDLTTVDACVARGRRVVLHSRIDADGDVVNHALGAEPDEVALQCAQSELAVRTRVAVTRMAAAVIDAVT